MRDPSVLMKYAEDCIKRSWEVQDGEQKRILKETADFWKVLAREVIKMNEFAERQVHASRAFRTANGLAVDEGSHNSATWPRHGARGDPPAPKANVAPADAKAPPPGASAQRRPAA